MIMKYVIYLKTPKKLMNLGKIEASNESEVKTLAFRHFGIDIKLLDFQKLINLACYYTNKNGEKCNNVWEYKASSKKWATCPKCHSQLSISKALIK